MAKKVCAFMAEGYEESEVMIPVDLLRRSGVEVTTVSITGDKAVTSSHGVTILADQTFEAVDFSSYDALFLPGGIPGTPNLRAHKGLEALITQFDQEKKYITAICAAPSIFAEMGLLKGRRATSHTCKLEDLKEAGAVVVEDEKVVVSDHIITSRGMGTAIPFGLTLVTLLVGEEMAEKIEKAIVY